MFRQVRRKEVEWERASCKGIDTDLFYEHKTGLELQGLTMNHLRRICFACPIQKDCLTIGVAHEPFGFWGGLSEEERKHMHARKQTKALFNLRRDLTLLGVAYETVVNHVYKIKRDFTYANESKF